MSYNTTTFDLGSKDDLKGDSPFPDKVSRGVYTNVVKVNKFGANADIDIGTEDIISIGGTLVEFSSASTVDVVSGDAADAAAGTGMRTVKLSGLDANGAIQHATITLTGAVAVTTTETWTFIYRAEGLTYGSGGTNAGAITFSITGGSDVMQIDVGEGQTLHSAYKIPTGCVGLLKRYWIEIEDAPSTSGVTLRVKNKKSGASYVTKNKHILQDGASREWTYSDVCPKFEADSIVKMSVTTDVNNTFVTGGFDLVIYPDITT